MKPLKDKIPIEPLSEPRWQRIDDAVFAALDADVAEERRAPSVRPAPPRSRRTVLYVAGSLAIAAVILAFVLRGVLFGDKNEVALNPSHIETGTEPSRLAIGESTVEVGPSSAVVASGDADHGVLVVLEKGTVECEVAPRKGRPPFVVQAGDVRVRVVGTRFQVQRTAKDVRVKVTHGTVEVSGGSQLVMLHDGESFPPSPAPTTASGPAASDDPSASPWASSTAPDPSAVSAPTAATGSNVAPSIVGAPAPSISPAKADQRAYDNAASLESRDPETAMATYKRLAAGSGPWAPTALFAAGRLAADRGRNADAKRHLQSYLSRFPHGANAEDARKILARLD